MMISAAELCAGDNDALIVLACAKQAVLLKTGDFVDAKRDHSLRSAFCITANYVNAGELYE